MLEKTRATELAHDNLVKFMAFSSIELDVEGSNIGEVGWCPTESDKEVLSQESYDRAMVDFKVANALVLFKNVSLQWESCDCVGQVYPGPPRISTVEVQGKYASFTSNQNKEGDMVTIVVDGDTTLQGVFVDGDWVEKMERK